MLTYAAGEPGCDKYKLVQGAMELAGLTATAWKLVTYKHPHSPMLIDAAELAATILAALPTVPTGMYIYIYVCIYMCIYILWC
jgi:hypothetical protein